MIVIDWCMMSDFGVCRRENVCSNERTCVCSNAQTFQGIKKNIIQNF